jgi:hypothetical protein
MKILFIYLCPNILLSELCKKLFFINKILENSINKSIKRNLVNFFLEDLNIIYEF